MNVANAFALVFEPFTLTVILASAVFGIFIGAIPGLTATMAAALLVPVTFYMPPTPALGAIVTCSAMAIFAGDIPGALLRIPGTPASAAYVEDTYLLGLKGRLGAALGANLIASALGGLFGTFVLVLLAPQLARFALNFSSYVYFWLALSGLSAATLVSRSTRLKCFVSLFLGLFLATVGLDVVTGTPRFTMGILDLMGGVSLIATLIAVFAISELLRRAAEIDESLPPPKEAMGSIFRAGLAVLARNKTRFLQGSVTGTLLGILPGAGADIAAWISYALSRRFSKNPENYGTGSEEAVVAPSASNNSALAGAYVPALVFGIPGDTITAIVIGVLLIKGLTPGPTVFTQSGDIVASIFLIFVLANLLMLPFGLAAIRLSKQVLSVNRRILYPIILIFSIVGAFAVNNAVFDLWLLIFFGLCGWYMEENGYPIGPLVLGMVLGKVVEESFVNSLIKSGGDFTAFVNRPVAGTLAVVFFCIWLLPFVFYALRRMRAKPLAG